MVVIALERAVPGHQEVLQQSCDVLKPQGWIYLIWNVQVPGKLKLAGRRGAGLWVTTTSQRLAWQRGW